jgi:flavin reductase (DIM6/NTAB) family NADH-FMN oxidoreductase RutF
VLGVHAVPADAPDLAELFGGETGDEVDKFARTPWHEGPDGVPILDRCRNWFAGRVLSRLDAGDHDAFLLEPIAGASGDEDEFTFHRAKAIHPGHPA